MKLTILICLTICNSIVKAQTNPSLKLVDEDDKGKLIPKQILMKKIEVENPYQGLFNYDFDKNGVKDSCIYSFGSQSFTRLLVKFNQAPNQTVQLYNRSIPSVKGDYGYWVIHTD